MDYSKALMSSVTIRKLSQKADSGKLTSKELNRLAAEYGRIAGECIRDQLVEEYPNGHVSEEDVRRIVSPILRQNHKYVSAVASMFLDAQYRKEGVGLKAVVPDYDLRREDDLVKEISQRSFIDELEG